MHWLKLSCGLGLGRLADLKWSSVHAGQFDGLSHFDLEGLELDGLTALAAMNWVLAILCF